MMKRLLSGVTAMILLLAPLLSSCSEKNPESDDETTPGAQAVQAGENAAPETEEPSPLELLPERISAARPITSSATSTPTGGSSR